MAVTDSFGHAFSEPRLLRQALRHRSAGAPHNERMDGVGPAGNGYIIVAGAGLPRIQVVGFQRRVDWPTLVARLESATSGQAAPIIK